MKFTIFAVFALMSLVIGCTLAVQTQDADPASQNSGSETSVEPEYSASRGIDSSLELSSNDESNSLPANKGEPIAAPKQQETSKDKQNEQDHANVSMDKNQDSEKNVTLVDGQASSGIQKSPASNAVDSPVDTRIDYREVVENFIDALNSQDVENAMALLHEESLLSIDVSSNPEYSDLNVWTEDELVIAEYTFQDDRRRLEGWTPQTVTDQFEIRDGKITDRHTASVKPTPRNDLDTGEEILIEGEVNLDDVYELVSGHGVQFFYQQGAEVTALTWDGEVVASHKNQGDLSFSLNVPRGRSYLLRVTMEDGTRLWAVSPESAEDLFQEISLHTSYLAALTAAHTILYSKALGENSVISQSLLDRIGEGIEEDDHATVKSIVWIVNHAILKKLDYSPTTEITEERIKAFGAGFPDGSATSLASRGNYKLPSDVLYGWTISYNERGSLNGLGIFTLDWDDLLDTDGTQLLDDREWIFGHPSVVSGGRKLLFTSNAHCHLDDSVECFDNVTDSSMFKMSLVDLNAAPERITPITMDVWSGSYDWSETKIVMSADLPVQEALHDIYVLDESSGEITRLTENLETDSGRSSTHPAWSPDGRHIAYSVQSYDGQMDIWIMDADGKNKTRLTSDGDKNGNPSFSPDGREIVFQCDARDDDICLMDVNGQNKTHVTNSARLDFSPQFDRTGLFIFYTAVDYDYGYHLRSFNTLTGRDTPLASLGGGDDQHFLFHYAALSHVGEQSSLNFSDVRSASYIPELDQDISEELLARINESPPEEKTNEKPNDIIVEQIAQIVERTVKEDFDNLSAEQIAMAVKIALEDLTDELSSEQIATIIERAVRANSEPSIYSGTDSSSSTDTEFDPTVCKGCPVDPNAVVQRAAAEAGIYIPPPPPINWP